MHSNLNFIKRRSPLPIDQHLVEIQEAIDTFSATILIAPTGAGKSTGLPSSLQSPKRIVIVQPRRAAARLVANRIAENLNETVGEGVGYHIRFDKKWSKDTRIVVVTEGMLLRWLQSNPFLDEISLVILDEFHERSVAMDLCLGLIREIQLDLREDLKLLIMSATLNPAPLKTWLGEKTPIIVSKGRRHPVEILHDQRQDDRELAERCKNAIAEELQQCKGDILVFLPGVREINDVFNLIGDMPEIEICPLHGRLSLADQMKAMSAKGRRKVILATNIAETSITLPRVDGVIDAGLQRVSHGDSGFSHLQTKRISLDAAQQRAGRAGRLRPGRCRRLWTQHSESSMSLHRTPEIKRARLEQTALQLLCWGVEPDNFNWFESPPAHAMENALKSLEALGATNENGLTKIGRKMSELPCEPALARLLIAADERNCLFSAAGIAAMLSEGFWLPEPHLMKWLKSLDRDARGEKSRKIRRQFLRLFPKSGSSKSADSDIAKAMISAFPNRIGKRRENSRKYLMADGSDALSPKDAQLGQWIIAPAMGKVDRGLRRIRAAIDIDPGWLDTNPVMVHRFVDGKVICERQDKWGAIILRSIQCKPTPTIAAELLFREALKSPKKALNPSREAMELKARIDWLSRIEPDLDLPNLEKWQDLLANVCIGRRSFEELRRIDICSTLNRQLTWTQRNALQSKAPSHLILPTGSNARIKYTPDNPPRVEARIQQLFGMMKTPRIGGQAIQIALLAPNNRPQQVTIDISSFWTESYPSIRKELRGRYPKHAWPEEPESTDAEDRPKRRHSGGGRKTK